MPRIESLLAARLFIAPQVAGDRLFFISNLSGQLSLYRMDLAGSVPEPLLPPHIALQNPDLLGGYAFYVFPALETIIIMVDHDGDENYQPMRIPIDGGFPEPAFGDAFVEARVSLAEADTERNMVYLVAESNTENLTTAYQADLATGDLRAMGSSSWGVWVDSVNADHTRATLYESYTVGDHVLSVWNASNGERDVLYGTPIEAREAGETPPLNAISESAWTNNDRGLVFITALFEDNYGLGYLDLARPAEVEPVTIIGVVHHGAGELVKLEQLEESRYLVSYNIDGASWVYEARFDEPARAMNIERTLCGIGELANGVLESMFFDKHGDRFALSFSTATSPTQIYTISGPERQELIRHTRERVLGIDESALASGEDASFISWDGQRVSARLYLPADAAAFPGPRPLILYVHGGPQGQERPDFAWFSMPLIQFLTLRGFAVFVPNVRGSTGYGLRWTKLVDRDWGGDDRLDHVHALNVLQDDPRVDTSRAGVVGRSYGGYMTLTLAARHPHLWQGAVDMFGPYDLLTFTDRIPETWKPYFTLAIGDPIADRDFLVERSPRTYIDDVSCPLLVIQGKNDPRVVEQESRDLVETLRANGKQVDYLMFENEGHDVLKFENRVACYNAITDFFTRLLRP